MEVETRYARSGDLRIAYQVHGDGPIDLLFAPGYLSHLEQNRWWPAYASFIDRLASFSRLIVFDRRGTGLSDRILALGSFEELMDDIAAVLDAARSERAALFGGAEGGPMCVLFAATFPERISALVLGASFARRTRGNDHPWGLDEETQRYILDGYEERWGRVGFGKTSAPSLVDDERFQAWYLQAQRFAGTPASARAWFRATMEIDVRHVLPAIRVPTLVIHRTGDRVIPVESGRYLAEHIPGAKYVEFPGIDHLPFVGDDNNAMADEIEEFLTGTRSAREPDRVLATVLFTDIVDSTRVASELGDRRWTELLAENHRLVRAELERHRGKAVRVEGDGTLSTFDGPARAVGCAVAIREAVRALGLELRAGLHTGEVELALTGIEGIAVHIGARVASLAGPGEVLVSSTVKDLVVGSGLEFADRGEHELKGVPGEWRVFALAR